MNEGDVLVPLGENAVGGFGSSIDGEFVGIVINEVEVAEEPVAVSAQSDASYTGGR